MMGSHELGAERCGVRVSFAGCESGREEEGGSGRAVVLAENAEMGKEGRPRAT